MAMRLFCEGWLLGETQADSLFAKAYLPEIVS
jgi:hypothetical protein